MTATNILGTPLELCCLQPKTGYFRDGYCNTSTEDHGTHVVCAVVTEEFLAYTLARGNNLRTPRPEYQFPGLSPGDKWCLCALRWLEAHHAGCAPPIRAEATHVKTLEIIELDILKPYFGAD